ncbi:Na+/H+ antiporter NhaC family protein [uncultured Muribaculum sp.]|uniref:Na+/H+ antiporter NhaC family protein n=1 Tax=uncultured Muribaculum sp. TaxID=1918613 RepID=UPI002595F8F9|nr:Na+/H+ antiporter NhaC family protein [uncultured Muribaculum sp.]
MFTDTISTRRGLLAISPIIVFLFFYLAVSLIIGDFYKMPMSVALLIASAWAVVISKGKPLTKRIEIFSRQAGSSNVMYMVWIFILAGAFATLAKETGSVEATVGLTLKYLPEQFIVPGLFVASCFISLSIGTSVGTVVALTPLAVEMAQMETGSIPFFVAVVLGGAFFGDNLSFISDTTIAATRTQGCNMSDKFKANVWITVPAAIVTLMLYVVFGYQVNEVHISDEFNPWLVLPYLVIIGCAVAGVNVTLVLSLGIAASLILGLILGYPMLDLFSFMGTGIDGMGQLIIVTLLAAGLLGLIKEAGGIDYILQTLSRHIHGSRGAQAAIALLVSVVNLCTANNTVAILTVGSLSKSISEKYDISPRKAASLLDTCSCITQSLIPYGAQTLLATGLAGISPADPWRYLYYPWALIVMVGISIIIKRKRR